MKPGSITIEDVAKLSGVSRGTVSRVLNGSKSVSAKTRDRVQRVIARTGYRPNPNARRTAGGRSFTVGIVIPMIGTEFYERLIRSFEKGLRDKWFAVMLFPVLKRDWLMKVLSYDIAAADTGGVFLCSFDIERLFSSTDRPSEGPVVLVDSYSPLYDSVCIDNELGGFLAGEKLCQLDGDTHVIMMHETLDSGFWPVFHMRYKGFEKAYSRVGKLIPPDNVHCYDFSWSAGTLAARDIFEKSRPPYNIFAMSDLYAFGVLREAQMRGLKVGTDVRIVGYDDQSLAHDLAITTVRQPIEEMGQQAVDIMLRRLEGSESEMKSICLKPEIIERDSL